MSWGYVAVGAGTLIGGYLSGQGAKNAANTQAGAALTAEQISQKEFNTITKQEQPFMNAGYGSINDLDYLLGIGKKGQYKDIQQGMQGDFGMLTKPFTTQDWKQLSPGYNFQRQQGQQGVLNGDESSVGALSGAAQKDLIGFNQGFANTSFNNAYNMYQTQQGNIYDRLAGVAQLGQASASNTGQQGTALAGQAAQSATNVGTAQAAGQVGVANAYSGVASNLGSMAYLYANQGGGMQPQEGQSAAYSDRRLKEDIKRIGETFTGLPLYSFRYKGDSQYHTGPMADEVRKVQPEAVITDKNGFDLVNYGMLH